MFFEEDKNKPQLRQLLKACTHLNDVDLAEIEVISSKLKKEHITNKDLIVDILVTTKKGQKILIEMQVQPHESFIERIVAYNARHFGSQIKRGEHYNVLRLRESISLIFTDFSIFPDTDEFTDHILFRRNNGKVFTKAQQFYIIDLTKLPKEIMSPVSKWGALLKAKTREELLVLMEMDQELNEAGKKLKELSADEKARYLAESRFRSQFAYELEIAAREEKGRNEGRNEGLVEGLNKGKIEIAKNLLALDLTLETISAATNLTIPELEQIKTDLTF